MPRWTRENDFDPLVWAAVDSVTNTLGPWRGLSRNEAFAAVKALIAKESAFNPAAVRGEPHLGDASVGLMQLLYSTARGLGFPGPIGDPVQLTGLFSPGANIYTGAKYLWRQLQNTGGNLDAAFSAYNGGYRPSLGFGALRTTSTPPVCLAWKPTAPKTGRILARDCARVSPATAGVFSNRDYVTAARNYYNYFFVRLPGQQGPARTTGTVPPPTG